MDKQSPRYYEFGPFRLNVTEHLLQKSDEVVPLTPKLVDTLAVLVENSGHVVTKDGLMQTLWPDSFVEESSLTQNISLLRKALAEHGNGQQYIETIPKRGYRFVAEVRELNDQNGGLFVQERTHTEVLIEEHLIHDSKEPLRTVNEVTVAQPNLNRDSYSRARKIALAGCAVLLVAAAFFLFQRDRTAESAFAPRSIAVLPFKTMNSSTQNDLMGLGIADALILKLSRLDQSSVLPISSVFRYVNREKDVVSIGRDLGVDTVLDGAVQQDGDRVRVTAQLISVGDGRTLWAGKFDDSYSSLFTLQDSISESMVTSLSSEIGSINKRPAAPLTKDPEAYQAYLTGFYFWNRRNRTNLSKAIDYLESAVNKDPNFAFAHAILADCYYLGSQDGYEILGSDESLRRANAAATRALDLDETIAEAHATRAGIFFEDGNYVQAEREFRRALELKPNYAVGHLRYGYFLFGDGKAGQLIDPHLTSEVVWRIDGTTLTRDETLKSDEDLTLSRWWVAVPSTLTRTQVEVREGERSDLLLDNETGLQVTVKAEWPLVVSTWTPADGPLGRGARRPVPLHLIYESPKLRLPAKRELHWRMSVRYLSVK